MAKCICGGRGWHPTWVEDPADPNGGYEGQERYCDCPAGKRLRRQERPHPEWGEYEELEAEVERLRAAAIHWKREAKKEFWVSDDDPVAQARAEVERLRAESEGWYQAYEQARAEEREACAEFVRLLHVYPEWLLADIADRIRARGDTPTTGMGSPSDDWLRHAADLEGDADPTTGGE